MYRSQCLRGLRRGTAAISLAGIAGSNPAEGMDVFRVCCQVEVSATGRSLVQMSPIEGNPSVISKRQRLVGPDPLRLSSRGKKKKLLLRACYVVWISMIASYSLFRNVIINPYPTAFPYGNGMVLHFYQQQESSTTKTVHKVINKGLKTYV